jgi:hypothetical protein
MLSFPNGGWQLADSRYSWDAVNKRLVRKKNNADS